MDHLILSSILQGITESLPVSSSLHLSLINALFNRPQTPDRVFEVFLHLWTMLSVLLYFWPDAWKVLKSLFVPREDRSLLWKTVLGTLSMVVVGFLVKRSEIEFSKSFQALGWVSIIFGILMFLVDRLAPQDSNQISYKKAFIIGLFQAASFVPGASRLGCALTGARFLGIKRLESAHFSFLLSLPSVLGAITLTSFDLFLDGKPIPFNFPLWLPALIISFSLISIFLFLKYFKKHSLLPFALYRVGLGVFLIWYF